MQLNFRRRHGDDDFRRHDDDDDGDDHLGDDDDHHLPDDDGENCSAETEKPQLLPQLLLVHSEEHDSFDGYPDDDFDSLRGQPRNV